MSGRRQSPGSLEVVLGSTIDPTAGCSIWRERYRQVYTSGVRPRKVKGVSVSSDPWYRDRVRCGSRNRDTVWAHAVHAVRAVDLLFPFQWTRRTRGNFSMGTSLYTDVWLLLLLAYFCSVFIIPACSSYLSTRLMQVGWRDVSPRINRSDIKGPRLPQRCQADCRPTVLPVNVPASPRARQ